MPTLREQILEAEFRFLEVLSDRQSIEAFEEFWSTLVHRIEFAASSNAIDADTRAQYHSTVGLVEELSQSMIEFYEDVETIDAAFRQDVLSQVQSPSSPPDTPSNRRDVSRAARWLSLNYYNPYPSNVVRDEISEQANWSRKDVDAWFLEARKRIGWNDIRRKFFNNKRAETVEEATKFFHCSRTSLSPALAQAFIDMESHVQELYIEPFRPSELVTSLGKTRGSSSVSDTDKGLPTRAMSSRASPPLHCVASHSQPLSPVSRSVSPLRASSKRRRSEVPDEDIDNVGNPSKRARQKGSFTIVLSQTQLPSPATSQPDLAEQTPAAVTADQGSGTKRKHLASLPNPQRKRSRSETQECPKYPSVGHRTRRLQTVSTPSSSYIQRSASPEIPPIPASRSNGIAPPSESVPYIPPTTTVLPGLGSSMVYELLSQAEIPEFPSEFPDPPTCAQPGGLQTFDLTLFNPHAAQSLAQGWDGTHFSTPSTLLGAAPQATGSFENVDITSISSFLNSSLNDGQFLGLLPLQFAHNEIQVPPVQIDALSGFAEVDVSFSPFLDFDVGLPSQLPQLQPDDLFFTDITGNLPPYHVAIDTEKAKQMAHLRMLKQHQNHLQERIQSLEEQITGGISALS